ncbi:putative mRNA capping enzyme [Danaus plexippus plexippus]|uniref:mRNA-capping enzyme n=2 Tax=Danaus plexippus TaxID=13037 RepID=A0A212EVT4_DANPL|nr:putative mRNA capping enzyme [Danaus plexippus plexippus]
MYRFTPSMVFDYVKKYKKRLGLWIDLTNTTRFYDRTEVENRGCIYKKLSCRGHGQTPSEQQTKQFIDIVSDYIAQNPNNLIGVHCTHGFNRTGFLLCAYMIIQEDCSVDFAIFNFAQERPPGIYKQDYIDELIKRFKGDCALEAPTLPDWCDEEQIDYDDNDRDGSSHSQSNSSRKREGKYINKKFMIEHEKVTLLTDTKKIDAIRETAASYLKWKVNDFPGAQPVSMTRKNIENLQKYPYQVSWKADGVRYMMLIVDDDEVYMIDRDNCIFKVDNLKFPHNTKPRHLRKTLLDGEMVIDKVDGREKPRYLIYDIIRFEDTNVGREHFYPVRLHCIEVEIVNPRNRAIVSGHIRKELEPFSVIIKRFWDVRMAHSLLEDKFIRTLHHEPDGLIFQPSEMPYSGGPCEFILKWKPSDQNSIDFKLVLEKETGLGLVSETKGNLYVGGSNVPFGWTAYNKKIKHLNNKIIECKLVNRCWVFMRERTDKSFPNSYTTAKAVMESIVNPVTKEYLLDFIKYNSYRKPDINQSKRPRLE